MIKYSFIVPVYNTEKYLKKCLDSLVNQTYKDFEIIVVNDGSTDKSSNIISKYQKKYKNIIVIDKENEGLSMARNRGVQKSSGKYIIFVDSDDYVSNKLLEEVDKKIDDSDILRFQIATEDEEYTKINEYHEEGFESMCGYDAFKYLSSYHFVEPAWCYVIRKNYYIENKFSFKKGVYHEDFGLIPYVIYKARKVKSIDFIGYYYIQRNGSIMNNNDYKKTVKKAFDMLEQYKTMRLFAKNINRKNNLDDYFLSYISNSVIVKARELKKDEKKVYINELKKLNVFDGVLVNTRIRRFKKYLMKHNLNLYLKVVR
ncbi:glycosyl transferase family 2 [Clostridium sp. CAG:594]|jgi:glycosyltransferase involved in cell wall biosynthesis|nr:glycosyl transferase family 2 [Clostridium sp. CAG:594]